MCVPQNQHHHLKVLIITSEWPTPEHVEWVPFIVQQVKFLRAEGIEIEVFSFRGGKNPLNYLRAWFELRRRFWIKSFTLIHAHFAQSALLALPKAIPLIVTFHGSDVQGFIGENGRPAFSGKILKLISRWVARLADRRIVVSAHLGAQLANALPAHVIPCGIDFEKFSPIPKIIARQKLNLPVEKLLVLFVANPVNPIKRYFLAEEAVAILKQVVDAQLIVVSSVPHELIPVYLSAGDALVLTSQHEGSPTIIKEALACNLPIVSVDVGDVRQRIQTIEGCVICDNDTPETIAKGLTKVLQNKTRINSREIIIKELDERVLIQQIIAVYQTVL